MPMYRKAVIGFFLACSVLWSAGIALSQTQSSKNRSQKPSTPSQKSARRDEIDLNKTRNKARVLLEKIDVIGTLAKPQAIFIIPGSDPKVEGIQIDRSFFVEIFRPVEKDFFPQKGRKKFRGAIPW